MNAGSVAITKTIWRNMIKTMPKEALRNKKKMAFITSTDVEQDWRDVIAEIQTDQQIQQGVLLIVATLRMDVKFAHEPYVVKANNIAIT